MSMDNEREALNREIDNWIRENYREFLYNGGSDNLDDDEYYPDGKFYDISKQVIWGSFDEVLLDVIGPMYGSCILLDSENYSLKTKRRVETK